MNPTPSPAPQRLGATYPPYPFWAWTCSRNPEVVEDKGQWHRLTGPLPRGRSWPFYYWLPDQPEKPTCDPRTTPSPAPQEVPKWAKDAASDHAHSIACALHIEAFKRPNSLLPVSDTMKIIELALLDFSRHAQPALTTVESELAELRKDRELLDCVDSSTEIQVIGGRNEFDQPFWIAQHRHKTQTIDCAGKSARDAIRCLMNRLAAIDAARNAQPAANTGDNRRTEDKL